MLFKCFQALQLIDIFVILSDLIPTKTNREI